ncbi:NAD(P)-dependent alcohol dehydrogenase [Nannocystis pusilla]|uniref:NAD(P)-dependent alcohol dehydrogenase n=1 Tax=Nannocystis pusilla TaxID=889268 RepID=A0ABS7TK88_9BACT|nr:NAD(P)-dependent alcohol dehydrogenase [Nannocystis pusilla]MBZ5708642.1 NAD(P)-dependent alcohol dehydrogenase [Nannocystis pusilla]
MKIRAAVAREREPFSIEECELDGPRAGEVLVEVEACGICHTDLSARDRYYGTPLPAVLGHEGVGRIVELGAGVSKFAVGERVVMSFGACGQCPNCTAELPGYCRHAREFNLFARRLDGSSPISRGGQPITGHFFAQSAFASHAVAATTNLVRLDDDLPGALMTSLACGVQTGMGAVMNVLQAGPRDVIGIFGCGTVGLAAVMAAKIAGCSQIVAVDVRPDRLVTARALGATEVVDSASEGLGPALRHLRGLTLAFDNTGNPEVIEAAYSLLRPRGRLALAGLSPRGAKLSLDLNAMMVSGRSVRGTVEGDADPRSFIPQMIAWYRRGELPLEELVTTYPFEQINQAAADMLAGRVIKPVLRMA